MNEFCEPLAPLPLPHRWRGQFSVFQRFSVSLLSLFQNGTSPQPAVSLLGLLFLFREQCPCGRDDLSSPPMNLQLADRTAPWVKYVLALGPSSIGSWLQGHALLAAGMKPQTLPPCATCSSNLTSCKTQLVPPMSISRIAKTPRSNPVTASRTKSKATLPPPPPASKNRSLFSRRMGGPG